MKKICPACKTLQDAVGFNLSDKEILHLKQLSLSEHLCKPCYNEKLSALLAATKAELIPLNEQKEITQKAYYEAYEAWKVKAAFFKAIDYNINLIKFEEKKVTIPAKKSSQSDKPFNAEKLTKQILAGLNAEQQEAIIRSFQTNQNRNN